MVDHIKENVRALSHLEWVEPAGASPQEENYQLFFLLFVYILTWNKNREKY